MDLCVVACSLPCGSALLKFRLLAFIVAECFATFLAVLLVGRRQEHHPMTLLGVWMRSQFPSGVPQSANSIGVRCGCTLLRCASARGFLLYLCLRHHLPPAAALFALTIFPFAVSAT